MNGLVFLLTICFGIASVCAPVIPQTHSVPPSEVREIKQPKLFTMLNLGLRSESGRVIAFVKNDFTLFPTVVPVSLELYSSEQYTTSYQAMTLRSHSYSEDLNMGQSLETSCPTNGETLYWLARAYYCEDGGEWKEIFTETMHYDGDGTPLPIG